MLFIILITILPTILIYLFFDKLIKSFYLKLSFSWFGGQYILAIYTFVTAVTLSLFGLNNLLQKALTISFISIVIVSFILYKQIFSTVNSALREIKLNPKTLFKIGFLALTFLFSFHFYKPHLVLRGGSIYTSPVYWDFKWHAPLIQNFVYGDNFPPQNESFAGVAATYHFFWGFLTAIYASKVGLISTINYISILSLFFLLTTIVGFGEEVFKSFWTGILAALLTITSSSLHFVPYFKNALNQREPFPHIIKSLLFNTSHPFFFSFVPGNPYGYNGTMFNMFCFLAERQIVIGVIFLIFFAWVIYKKDNLTNTNLIIMGLLGGSYFLWHLFITIMIFSALLFLVIVDKERKKTLSLLIPFSLVFIIHLLYFKHLTNSGWFYPDVKSFPKINFNFPTMGKEYPFSILHALGYYVYGYGFKIILLFIGLFFLKKKDTKLFLTLLSVIIPTFILINTVQLSPLSIYDNHKWLRPMNVIIDLIASFALYQLFTSRKLRILSFIFGVFLFILSTMSGFLELIPFLNSQPTNLYARYPSPLILSIRNTTKPQSTFLTQLYGKEVQLAGRKLFLGDYAGQDLRLKKRLREEIINQIYSTTSLKTFCSLTRQYKIDYVEGTQTPLALTLSSDPITKQEDNQMPFIEVKKVCGKYP